LAMTAQEPPAPISCLGARKIQLDHDIVVVGEEQLVDRRLWGVGFAIFDSLLVQRRLDPLKVGSQKGKVVEGSGIWRRAATDRVVLRHQMNDRNIPAIEPIARGSSGSAA